MGDDSSRALDERILLLAPTRRDAVVACRVLGAEGLSVTPCGDIVGICSEIERGAAVAIVPEEAILKDERGCLAQLLKQQPPWSDFPLIVLTPPPPRKAARGLESVGHMTLMQRPVAIRSLVSTVEAALRDRRRQYARREDFAELERQSRTLRDNDRHKDEFLAMLAHELRNPLAAVKNAVSVLRMSLEEEGRAWASDVVERQVRQLVRLIDDLLDVSRITSGKIRLRKEFVDAGPILDLAIEAARPLIDERGHALSVSIERGGLPLHVDPARVEQIVLNLLTNAAKYTDRGGRIWLTARREGEWVVIAVKDDGMGIPPDKLPEMFQLFTQADRSLARSEGGLGIGLTVVQKLAEIHGGSVAARSEGAGRGSEFIVSLPRVWKPSESETEARPGDRPLGRGSRILVVDDNADAALSMVRLLKLLGNEAIAVHDGRAAVDAAISFRPDVVLLDIGLPGLDGYQVASALRRDVRNRDAVLIALTGYGQDEDRRRAIAAGFDHHLVKPVEIDSLISLIGRVV